MTRTDVRMRWSPLYAIVDAEAAAARGWTPLALAEACLRGGATILQVRAKTLTGAAFLRLCRGVAAAARPSGATVIVNDRADLARLSDAGGVHVGQDDLPVAAVRRLLAPGGVIGLSTHTLEQVERAVADGVDYIAVGPVLATGTKQTGYTARGIEFVRQAVVRAGDTPVVAIGGVTLREAPAILATGVRAVAVISDLMAGGDPQQRVRDYLSALASVPP